jgi:hypothetical protein
MNQIPVIINNRDRLTTTKKLVEDLFSLGYRDITIIDNGSTYPPLLEWYNVGRFKYDSYFYPNVHWSENLGQLAIYNSGLINQFKHYPWIAYTDSDIELNPNTPINFIQVMISISERYGYDKCGLALRIDNLPDTDYANKAREWEGKYWENKIFHNIFIADVDTTFSIIKPNLPFMYKSLRVAGELTARHIPWYNDINNLNEEELYYAEHSDNFSTYKRYYETFKNQNV